MNIKFNVVKVLIISICTLVYFNNCAGGAPGESQLSSTADESSDQLASSLPPSSSNNNSLVQSSESCVAPTSQSDYKLYVSKSLNGPWVENGSACQGETSYFKITGVKAGSVVKGCTSPSSDKGCLDLNKHRVFTSAEIVGSDIITRVTASESYAYPLTEYSFFLSFLGDKKILLEKVGASTFRNCGIAPAAPPPSAQTCSWQIVTPRFVIGGGNNVLPSGVCSQATKGQKAQGYYDMGGGNRQYDEYECRCQ